MTTKKRWSRIELWADGLTFLKVNGGNADVLSRPYFQMCVSYTII